jgi:hypothetical protein
MSPLVDHLNTTQLTFWEAFLTVCFASGTTFGLANGTSFPGWWTFSVTMAGTLGFALLAGIRAIQKLNATPPPPGK